MKTYNGHRSWNAWNVALWIANDEPTYRFAMQCLDKPRVNRNKKGFGAATRTFMRAMDGARTPDGAVYNALSVRLALEGLAEE